MGLHVRVPTRRHRQGGLHATTPWFRGQRQAGLGLSPQQEHLWLDDSQACSSFAKSGPLCFDWVQHNLWWTPASSSFDVEEDSSSCCGMSMMPALCQLPLSCTTRSLQRCRASTRYGKTRLSTFWAWSSVIAVTVPSSYLKHLTWTRWSRSLVFLYALRRHLLLPAPRRNCPSTWNPPRRRNVDAWRACPTGRL